MQILYLNLVTDVFPALALGVGEGDSSVMRRAPRPRGEPLMTRRHIRRVVGYGVLLAANVLGYLNSALSLSGDGSLDGFTIVGAPAGSALPAGHTLVVAKSAADVYELPGVPIRQEAANIALGGIDTGLFAYSGFLVKNLAGIVDVAPAVAARGGSSK